MEVADLALGERHFSRFDPEIHIDHLRLADPSAL
jgi:hypothetical protein